MSAAKHRRDRIKEVRQQYRELTYAVVTFDHAGGSSEVIRSGLTREEADAEAFGFNGECEKHDDTFRAAVVLDGDLHPQIPHQRGAKARSK